MESAALRWDLDMLALDAAVLLVEVEFDALVLEAAALLVEVQRARAAPGAGDRDAARLAAEAERLAHAIERLLADAGLLRLVVPPAHGHGHGLLSLACPMRPRRSARAASPR
jgi:hypothetical protein